MEVDFELTMADLLALSDCQAASSPTLKRQRRRARLLVPVLFILIGLLLWLISGDETIGLGLAVLFTALGLIFFVRYPAMIRSRNVMLIRRMLMEEHNAALFRRRRLSITPETITEATEVHVSTWKWIAIGRVVTDRDRAFFFVTSSAAFVLPRAAFVTDEAFQEFVATAQRYRSEAQAVVDPLAPGGERVRT